MQLQKNCLGPSATSVVFEISQKNIQKLGRHSRTSSTSQKHLGPPATSEVFGKSQKYIQKLGRHSKASTTSQKYLGPPGTSVVFEKSQKNIQKLDRHSVASATSQKISRANRKLSKSLKNHRNIFKSLADILKPLQLHKNIYDLQEL